MKKRIFSILTLALTLALFAFPVFAAPFNPEDISLEKIESFSGCNEGYSNEKIGTVTLDEGLYIFDCDFSFCLWPESGEIYSGTFLVKNSSSSTLLSCYIDQGNSVYYVYVTSSISVYISAYSPLDYIVDIYSTKHYNDFEQEGYQEGYNDGYYFGYDNGYIAGEVHGSEYGYENGYTDGYAEGLTKANDYAYNSGYEIGKEEGRGEGYNTGYAVGKHAGYILGEADGWENAIKDADEVKTAIGGIFTGVFDGAVDSFNELTEGITIMGLTLKQILLTIAALGIIGICIWLFALKK